MTLGTMDRIRIERTTWTMNARLQDLPRSSRIARRRELRDNLRAAAEDVGARRAIQQLGDLHELAVDYLSAEYGDLTRRPSWTGAAVALLAIDAAMLFVGHVATSAFRAGVAQGSPHATGSFSWPGVHYLISRQTFVFTDGASTSTGGAWTPAVYVLMVLAAILAGKLWRLTPSLRYRPRPGAVEAG